jgi:hypothetical protein
VRLFCVAILIALASHVAVADNSSVEAQRLAASSRIVLATVSDTGNRPLTELGPDDFAIQEGARTRDVLSVHMADYPIAVLLDDTAAAVKDADAIRAATARFISKVGERAVAIGTLTDPSHLLVPFDAGRAAALDRARRFTPAGGTPLVLQAAAHMANAVLDTGSPFAAIVVVSAAPVPVSAANDREFLTPILKTGAPVYVIANLERDGAAASATVDVLRAMAEQTRGQYTPIYSSASYAIALDRLADRLATELMIEYLIPAGDTPAGDVRVGVKIPGARATGLGVSK